MIYQRHISGLKVCTILAAGFYVIAPLTPTYAQAVSEIQDADSLELEESDLPPVIVTVTDKPVGYQGAPEWVYNTPSAVSVIGRETIKNASVRRCRRF